MKLRFSKAITCQKEIVLYAHLDGEKKYKICADKNGKYIMYCKRYDDFKIPWYTWAGRSYKPLDVINPEQYDTIDAAKNAVIEHAARRAEQWDYTLEVEHENPDYIQQPKNRLRQPTGTQAIIKHKQEYENRYLS